jgi:hypothetical protein|tara:strand:+ start:1026 stop:2555 length:1530 start_codon:yes stop_codon:yes gene_type:complete
LKIFGFDVKRAEEETSLPVSFAEPSNDDGAITVGNALGGFYNTILDMEGSAKTESELITKYRAMAMQPEINQAVDDIVNEAISVDTNDRVVEVSLGETDLSDKVKKTIVKEFDNVLALLDFTNNAYDMFQKFYVDGRLNYHIVIDPKDVKKGVIELRYVDPRKLKLIREVDKKGKDPHSGVPIKVVKNEYYMYSESGFLNSTTGGSAAPGSSTSGIKISKDSIARVTSGLMNENNSLVLSHLHPATKALNQLRMLEDAVVIYTLTRAPERRIFYIDVGNLPKNKAEQYLRDMMARHKNKLQYNSSTGEMTDSRKMLTMTEDFWFPRRGGERSTEVDTLAGGNAPGLSSNENLEYFQRKLYKALKVPLSRLEPEAMSSFGRTSEMTRDELKFGKFIRRIRSRFSWIFNTILEKQLILKGILTPEEFNEIRNDLRYDFVKDNYFEELKESEILRERLNTLRDISDYTGKYFSHQWITRNVLQMTDEDMTKMEEQIEEEKALGGHSDGDDPY